MGNVQKIMNRNEKYKDFIKITGALPGDAVRDYMAACDVIVLTSITEGFLFS